MSRFAAVSMLLSLGSYSQAASAAQTPAQIRQLVEPFALRQDAELGISSHSNKVLEGPWAHPHLGLSIEEMGPKVDAEPWDPSVGALTEFPPASLELQESLSPKVPSLPAYDLWQLKTAPLLAEPGWMPIEGVLVGPGISFGVGFPVRFLDER